jgi:hypothetical protein
MEVQALKAARRKGILHYGMPPTSTTKTDSTAAEDDRANESLDEVAWWPTLAVCQRVVVEDKVSTNPSNGLEDGGVSVEVCVPRPMMLTYRSTTIAVLETASDDRRVRPSIAATTRVAA